MTLVEVGCTRHGDADDVTARNEDAAGLQESPAGVDDRRDVVLQQRQHAAQIGDDDIDSLGQGHRGRHLLDEVDPLAKSVGPGNRPGRLDGTRRLDGVNAVGATQARETGHDARAGADVGDRGPRPDGVAQRGEVRGHPPPIANHVAVGGNAIHGRRTRAHRQQ